MDSRQAGNSRMLAFLQFFAAILYLLLARMIAQYGAAAFVKEEYFPLAEQLILACLLLFGYAGMGFSFNRQSHPIAEQGLPFRTGWMRETGMGLAIGWTFAFLCVLPLTIIGGIAVTLTTGLSSWGWLIADAIYFAFFALAEEIAFRGYGFQRFASAVGGAPASLLFAVFYATFQAALPGANRVSSLIAFVMGLLLSIAYLRTRALWVSWGINFGWKASRALLFGLAICGVNNHSPIVQGNPMGPFWLSGGGYGLDASWVTLFVAIAVLFAVIRLTHELNYKYNTPVIISGGIPVDIDAAARRQHEIAMANSQPAVPAFVQILPAAPVVPATPVATVEDEPVAVEQRP